jgi:hypothetical protein
MQDNSPAVGAWFRPGRGGEQRLGIGMQRLPIKFFFISQFYDAT